MDNMSPDISNTGYEDSDPTLTGQEGSDKFIGKGDTAKRSNIGDNEASHTKLEDTNKRSSRGGSRSQRRNKGEGQGELF